MQFYIILYIQFHYFGVTNELSQRKLNKNVLNKLNQGHSRSKIRKESKYGKFELNALQRDHSQDLAIFDPASVGVK